MTPRHRRLLSSSLKVSTKPGQLRRPASVRPSRRGHASLRLNRAILTLLRLPAETLPVFRERLVEAFPDRFRKVWSAIADVRGGKWNESRFGERMRGAGPRWEAIEGLFEAQCRRLGLNRREGSAPRSGFRRPSRQADLFPLDS